MKIDPEKLVVEFEEEHEDLDDIEDLVSELPDSTPRFVVYTYVPMTSFGFWYKFSYCFFMIFAAAFIASLVTGLLGDAELILVVANFSYSLSLRVSTIQCVSVHSPDPLSYEQVNRISREGFVCYSFCGG